MEEEEFNNVVLSNITAKDPFLRERNQLALMLGYHAGLRTGDLIIKGNLCVKKLRKLLPFQVKRVPTAIKLSILSKGGKSRGIQLTVKGTTAIYDFLWGRAKNIKTTLMCSKAGKPLTDEDFGTHLFRSCINSYLAKTSLNEDDAETWVKRRYHTLRKCYATNAVMYCQEKGLDPRIFVTQWMGHADPETTDIYIFYDAVLRNRIKTLEELNLNSTLFGRSYKNKYKGKK
jgi:integrase